MMQHDQKIVDKLGNDVVVGDRIVVAHCEVDGDAYLSLAHVLHVRRDGVLDTLEDAYRGAQGPRRTTRRPDEVIVTPHDGKELIEQFLPTGTTFEANYGISGHSDLGFYGRFSFTVLDDGRVRDEDGDEAPMDAINVQTMHHVQLPEEQH